MSLGNSLPLQEPYPAQIGSQGDFISNGGPSQTLEGLDTQRVNKTQTLVGLHTQRVNKIEPHWDFIPKEETKKEHHPNGTMDTHRGTSGAFGTHLHHELDHLF